MPDPTLDQLRRFAIARSLFEPTSLMRAFGKLGFVQADPIRAPARAQDLTLRPRVKNYRAGDLERAYPRLALEEDFFLNYGFLPREHALLMHPRTASQVWDAATRRRAGELLAFVRARGSVHPREAEAQFAHGSVVNYWGGTSNATTHLLDAMHYRSLLRVVKRENGVRLYAAREVPERVRDLTTVRARLDALVDLVVSLYAPLPVASLGPLIGRLRHGVPQWRAELKRAIERVKQRLAKARVAGIDWYWPADERVGREPTRDRLYLLAPFDPVVWDRRRFEIFWGWAYRFEAYTPVAKRKLGYYALPVLWRDRVIAWANLSLRGGQLDCQLGCVGARPTERAFERELEAELARMREFLG
jgi:uncharacterized protein YcaQ